MADFEKIIGMHHCNSKDFHVNTNAVETARKYLEKKHIMPTDKI
jgi:hypothetical protein